MPTWLFFASLVALAATLGGAVSLVLITAFIPRDARNDRIFARTTHVTLTCLGALALFAVILPPLLK